MSKPKYYISTAIAYTSSRPHIGNTYEIVLADSIARYKRMEGYDVYFQTGTDEHGQKIEEKANAAGITPKEYVDNVAKIVKAADKLSAYLKCVEELKAGNSEFESAAKQTYQALEAMHLPCLDYFMAHFLDSFRLTLDELE